MSIRQPPTHWDEADTLWNETQAAELLGLSVRTLQNWRLRGGGPPYQKLGRTVRYSLVKLREWIAQGSRTNTSDPGESAK